MYGRDERRCDAPGGRVRRAKQLLERNDQLGISRIGEVGDGVSQLVITFKQLIRRFPTGHYVEAAFSQERRGWGPKGVTK
jgi:hypothetical protein